MYDPNGGYITGGGWINVGAGSYTAEPDVDGRANFGFNSQYKKNANIPTGETEFNFQVGNLNFHSTAYSWLVVSGFKAQYKGTGTMNGAGLQLHADGVRRGHLRRGGVDKFRIVITDGNNGNARRLRQPERPADRHGHRRSAGDRRRLDHDPQGVGSRPRTQRRGAAARRPLGVRETRSEPGFRSYSPPLRQPGGTR